MSDLMQKLWNNIKDFARFLILYFTKTLKDLVKAGTGVHPKDRIKDALAVLRSTAMLLFLNLLALVIFIFLSQGRDVIYIVTEDVISCKFGSLLWLLGSLVWWSYVSEFASRYAIYVTDNSGVGLTSERVAWRKELQHTLSGIFLILPYFIVLISFVVNFIFDKTLDPSESKIGFGIPALLVYLLLNVAAKVYFTDPNNPQINWFIKFLIKIKGVKENEKEWANLLYGMYDDFIFTIKKPENFSGEPYALLKLFINDITKEGTKKDFPQNPALMDPASIVPREFKLKRFDDEGGKLSGRFRWVYYIPNSFYKTLHKQLLLISSICLALFLFFTFSSISGYQDVGTPALMILSFACWMGIYIGVLFLDYGVFRPGYKFLEGNEVKNDEWAVPTKAGQILSRISIRFILFVLLIFCSFVNLDHPVRYNSNGACCTDNRPALKEHFVNWFKQYTTDSTTQYILKEPVSAGNDTLKFYPVVFICAEGGALRTGAFTAMLLSHLQDSLLKWKAPVDFQKSIYAFSGVSGGSVGLSFFNAEAFLNGRDELLVKDSLISGTKNFFRSDFLSPVIGKMLYGDVLNLFMPRRTERFDRAIALELSWEDAYQNVINDKGRNYFGSNYMQIFSKNHTYPAIFINTTEVETGRQCWLCNVKPDTSMFKSKDRDICNYKLRGGINYSTMINFSSRFPLLSPAGTIIQNDAQKYHYVDGGYVENTGSATMIEILKILKPHILYNVDTLVQKGFIIKPYVIQIRFGEAQTTFKNINFGNEYMEILDGIYNTREGRIESASNDLENLVHTLGGEFIPLKLDMNTSKVPMNWVLSDKSLDNVLISIRNLYSKAEMNKLFPFDTAHCRQRYPNHNS